MKSATSLTVLSCSLLLTHCQFTTEIELLVREPDLPRQWVFAEQELEWEIEYIDLSGEIIVEEASNGFEQTVVRTPKWNNVPVLVYPLYKGVKMKPAGALVPTDADGSGVTDSTAVVDPSWDGGATAALFRQLWITSSVAAGVNSERLSGEVAEKAEEETYGNPWALDWAAIGEGFRFGSFSSHLIGPAPSYELDLEAVPGTWVSGDPLFPTVTASSGGRLSLSGLYPGLHRFFHKETGKRIDLYITEKGWYCINLALECIESGSW
jgi:hypothetical protein